MLEFYIEGGCNIGVNYAVAVVDADNNRIKDDKIAKISKEIGLNRTTRTVLWEYHRQKIKLDGEGLYDLVDDSSRAQVVRSVSNEAILYVEKLKGGLK